MTVNTNGNKYVPDGSYVPQVRLAQPASELTDREILIEIRDSQLRTELLVQEFIDGLGKNPMFKMLASKFGG